MAGGGQESAPQSAKADRGDACLSGRVFMAVTDEGSRLGRQGTGRVAKAWMVAAQLVTAATEVGALVSGAWAVAA